MGEKDMTEMTLEAYNDVFADIFNVLAFHGERVIDENDLEDVQPKSLYKVDGKIHQQERDTAKIWKSCNIRISFLGLENQTAVDPWMPVRVMGYDGAAYRAQMLDDQQTGVYPVITLVLYFGKRKWNAPQSLHESLELDERLKPWVSDYHMNLFEIAYLTDEQINQFQSDFRIVAEYFSKSRTDPNYRPSDIKIRHVHEVLQLMSVMTGDDRYEKCESLLTANKGGEVGMCQVLDRMVEEGRMEQLIQNIKDLIAAGFTAQKAMDIFHVEPEERDAILQKLV